MTGSGMEMNERFARVRRWVAKRTGSRVRADLPPLLLDLLSLDQLARHARDLAADHEVDRRPGGNVLLARLEDNALALDDAHAVLSASVRRQNRLTPAGEWLLDNFYLLEEQLLLASQHLPRSYNRELPRLLGGPYRDLPRVYALAVELITHVDARVEESSVDRFLGAYQERAPIGLGELWALPIMLRLALIEVVRRVAERVAVARVDRDRAAVWTERFRQTAERSPSDLVMVLADLARSDQPLSDAFVAEFIRRIQARGHAQAMVTDWLEQRLAPRGSSLGGGPGGGGGGRGGGAGSVC
jgi:cyclic beta-1,2-glucan synthetase